MFVDVILSSSWLKEVIYSSREIPCIANFGLHSSHGCLLNSTFSLFTNLKVPNPSSSNFSMEVCTIAAVDLFLEENEVYTRLAVVNGPGAFRIAFSTSLLLIPTLMEISLGFIWQHYKFDGRDKLLEIISRFWSKYKWLIINNNRISFLNIKDIDN